MDEDGCWDCGGVYRLIRLPHGWIRLGCRRRRHYHPEACPGCGIVRPLAWLDGDRLVCASCAAVESIFGLASSAAARITPYGAYRCARCFLRERLTELLTDPTTNQIHTQLLPAPRHARELRTPANRGVVATGRSPAPGRGCCIKWPEVRSRSATTPSAPFLSDRPHDYLRCLLTALGVLDPMDIQIERMLP